MGSATPGAALTLWLTPRQTYATRWAPITVDSINLTLVSEEGESAARIDGGGASRLFSVRRSGSLTIRSVVLTNTQALDGEGGVIRVEDASLTMIRCAISGVTLPARWASGYGGVLYLNRGAALLTGCIVSNVSAFTSRHDVTGLAIFASSSSVQLSDCLIQTLR